MYGLPDSWAGYGLQKVVAHKPNSRKRSPGATENLEGWAEIWTMWKMDREAKKKKRSLPEPQKEEAFTPKEEKQNRVRFRVVDD